MVEFERSSPSLDGMSAQQSGAVSSLVRLDCYCAWSQSSLVEPCKNYRRLQITSVLTPNCCAKRLRRRVAKLLGSSSTVEARNCQERVIKSGSADEGYIPACRCACLSQHKYADYLRTSTTKSWARIFGFAEIVCLRICGASLESFTKVENRLCCGH